MDSYYPAYLDLNSHVLHKMKQNSIDERFITVDKIRIERSVLERKYFGEKDYTDVSRDSNIELINAKIIFNCLEELKNENERYNS